MNPGRSPLLLQQALASGLDDVVHTRVGFGIICLLMLLAVCLQVGNAIGLASPSWHPFT